MTDRRRVNGPPGGTVPPIYTAALTSRESTLGKHPARNRAPEQPRKIFLKTGINPSASGSSYFEYENNPQQSFSLLPASSNLKLICNIHGPKPLPRSAPFSPQLSLSTFVKFAPFATRQRRGWIRDQSERDLGAHLETALRGVIIGDRWPKSGVDVIITILEGEEDRWWGDEVTGGSNGGTNTGSWGLMTVLSACITAASAALVEAGIDCVDVVAGGVAAIVRNPDGKGKSMRVPSADSTNSSTSIVVDPTPSEHHEILASCVVGYLPQRDEITELWISGDIDPDWEELIDSAIEAARLTGTVLFETIKDIVREKGAEGSGNPQLSAEDITMAG